MGKCVHVIPGRARFSVPALRKNAAVEEPLIRSLRAVEGVEAVELRRASASVVVHFDPRRLHVETLSAVVLRHASPDDDRPAAAPAPRRGGASAASRVPTVAKHLVTSPVVVDTARHLGGVIRSTAFKVILEKAVQSGVRRLLRGAPVRL